MRERFVTAYSRRATQRLIVVGCAAVGSWIAVAVCLSAPASGSGRDAFVSIPGPDIALIHVDVVDGTGGPPQRDQTVVIAGNRINAVGPTNAVMVPPNSQVIDLRGHTVIPGLVGMHNHLFYAVDGGDRYISVGKSFARLYLAAGVTSIRTAGTIDRRQDDAIKQQIEDRTEAGPRIHLSGQYLEGSRDASAWGTLIDNMANAGVTSLKVYTSVPRGDLATIIEAGHQRGLKVTGHLCAVGFREAAALGIDNLEHGLIVDTEFNPRKVEDRCPDWGGTVRQLAGADVDAAPIQATIRELVSRGVAITSTLAVFDSFTTRGALVDARLERFLAEPMLKSYRRAAGRRAASTSELKVWDAMLETEMAFERRFVRAGGLLMAGADPTSWGATLAGLADQRNVELLVEAGFTPVEAIRIATFNGASFLGEAATSGTVQPGKRADLVALQGDLASDIRNIRNVHLVFVDGVGFDPKALAAAERGLIGAGIWNWKPSAVVGTVLVVLLTVIAYDRRQRRMRLKRRGTAPTRA
jgi:imidazolonepropionase-like amidohydrolase